MQGSPLKQHTQFVMGMRLHKTAQSNFMNACKLSPAENCQQTLCLDCMKARINFAREHLSSLCDALQGQCCFTPSWQHRAVQ